ncbi:MAG: CsiV family protein [bacterium]
MLLALLALTSLSGSLVAETSSIYQIELIMFQRFQGGENETWPSETAAPEQMQSVRTLYSNVSAPTPAEVPAQLTPAAASLSIEQTVVTEPADVEILDDADLTMGPMAYSLKRKGYLVPVHIGWRQHVKPWKSHDWSWIETDTIQGNIRVTRQRFLHLDTDLLITDLETGEQFAFKDSRKMRRDEFHHIDHPRGGILINVQRWTPPETETNQLELGPIESSPGIQNNAPQTP